MWHTHIFASTPDGKLELNLIDIYTLSSCIASTAVAAMGSVCVSKALGHVYSWISSLEGAMNPNKNGQYNIICPHYSVEIYL